MDLPDECWELIFNGVVGHRDYHLDSISLVCKRFLSISNSVKRTLTISDPRILCHDNLSKLFRRFNNIIHIRIENGSKFRHHEDFDRVIVKIARSGLDIEELNLSSWPDATNDELTDMITEVISLRELGSNMKNLKTLKCNFCILKDDLIAILKTLQYFSNLNSLSVLTLGGLSFLMAVENSFSHARVRALCALEFMWSVLSDTLLDSIAEAHLPLKKLKFIRCSGFTFSGLSLLLHEYQSLNDLSLVFTDFLTDQHMKHLSKYLSNLTHIDLSKCRQLTNSTFFTLARRCPSLVHIIMSITNIGREGEEGEIPMGYLEKNNQIQRLELCENVFLNDESLKKIGYVCPNLQMLDLSGCWEITDKGMGEILKSCSNMRHLKVNACKKLKMIVGIESEHSKLSIEVLEAKKTRINKKGMAMIGMRCPGLLELNLNCCEVKEEGVMEVVEKCSNLMEIQLIKCSGCSTDVLYRMLLKRPSLRKIIIGYESNFLTEDEIDLFFRHGCRVYKQNFEDLNRIFCVLPY